MSGFSDRSTHPLTAMMLIATVALALAAQAVVAPALIVTLLAVHAFFGWPRFGRPRTYHALILAVPFALWWRDYEHQSAMTEQVPVGFLFIVGLYMCALGAQHVLSYRRGGNLDYALACAIMGLALAGTAGRDRASGWFTPMLVGFVVLLLTHLRIITIGGGHRGAALGPSIRHALALGAVIIATALVEVHVVRRLPALNQWAVNKLISSGVAPQPGFSRTAQLGSIPETWRLNSPAARAIALRLFSDSPPDYLRGAAFDYYDGGRWSLIEEDRVIDPAATDWNRNVFDTLEVDPDKAAAADPARLGVVYPEPEFSQSFLVPPGTHRMGAYVTRARFGRAYTVRPQEGDLLGGYAYYEPELDQPEPGPRDLHVPFDLRWKLMRHASRIMDPEAPPAEKIRQLIVWFDDHYDYKIGIEIAGRKDPVLEFLENHNAGHCEFFAASTTLLLRTQGIPARYVTGFAVREQGDSDDLWLVRRRDAHAWVEAYVEGVGWAVVESTPASAMPPSEPETGWDAESTWWEAWWTRLWHAVRHGGLTAAVKGAWDWLASLPRRLPVWAWLVLIGAGVLWTFRQDLRTLVGRRRAGPVPPHVRAVRKKLDEAEKLLARHGVTRPPSQTVAALLDRLSDPTPATAVELPDDTRRRVETLLTDYQNERFRPIDRVG